MWNELRGFTALAALVAVLALLLVLAAPAVVAAQEDVTLVPFTDETYGVQGLMPDGWTDVGSGIRTRGATPEDTTVVVLQAAVAPLDAVMDSLLPQFGLTSAPEAVGTQETAAFEWTLYQLDTEQNGMPVRLDLALADEAGKTYLVLMQASLDEFDALHESVFVPMLDSLAPMEPVVEDVPYTVEQVTFTNGDVTLAGTLTIPQTEGKHPAVVMMTGSGPQDRDEMVIPGFPIFKLIADDLTRQGIAVLRYDDRGVGQSTGEFNETSVQEFASDGIAGVAYLRSRDDINPAQVGVFGHSEGGLYSAMIGANPDSGVAFIVSLAGTAVPGMDLLREQNRLILEQAGASQAQIDLQLAMLDEINPLLQAGDMDAVEQAAYEAVLAQFALMTPEEQAALGGDGEAFARQSAAAARQSTAAEWYGSFIDYNPAPDWAQTTVPVLAVFGGKDVQVDDAQNAAPMTEALVEAGNHDFAVVVLPDANHLFQSSDTGSLEEYAVLPPELTPDLMPTVSGWLLQHVTVVE
jgi:pimeloyl-ACP methyl ester carboxylesterase